MKESFLFIALLTLPSFCLSQESPIKSEYGLEAGGSKIIPIIIVPLEDAAKDIGLTDQIIQTKCEFKLRQINLIPIDPRSMDPTPEYYLQVAVGIKGSAFVIELLFIREVIFTVEHKQYYRQSSTWTKEIFGTHGNNPSQLLGSLEDCVEDFANKYSKTNLH